MLYFYVGRTHHRAEEHWSLRWWGVRGDVRLNMRLIGIRSRRGVECADAFLPSSTDGSPSHPTSCKQQQNAYLSALCHNLDQIVFWTRIIVDCSQQHLVLDRCQILSPNYSIDYSLLSLSPHAAVISMVTRPVWPDRDSRRYLDHCDCLMALLLISVWSRHTNCHIMP